MNQELERVAPGILDFEQIMQPKINGFTREYISFPSGTDRQQTYLDCREAFKRYRLRPRVLQDVSSADMATTVLGRSISFAVCISPTACHSYVHHDKEIATSKAAGDYGTVYTLSSCSNTLLEDVAKVNSSGLLWMQTYMYRNRDVTKALVKAAEKSGYHALVVTIDAYGGRHTDSDFEEDPHPYYECSLPNTTRGVDPDEREGLSYHLQLFDGYGSTVKELKWLRSFTNMKIVLKGILTGKTVKVAIAEGIADGILVSAHGGRQLDGVPSTIDALSEVVQAVQGSGVEVYLDGGVRTGTDVLKAIALGARAVFVGRPILWGLNANGQNGVKRILDIYKDELRLAMILTGCSKLEDITPNLLIHESDYLSSKL